MNTAVLMFSACLAGADPAVVPAGHAVSGDCCGKAVVVNDCGPKCGCGLFGHLRGLFHRTCSKPACDVCPKPAPVCKPCPKPVVHAPACDTCAPKKSCGFFSCFNFHINLCHSCAKPSHKGCDKGCDKGCGTAVVAPAGPVQVAPVTPRPDAPKAIPPRVGTNYNPVRPDLQPVSESGKIIIDVVPRN